MTSPAALHAGPTRFEPWFAFDYPYAGGWLITRGAPWEPGHPERIIATVRDGETAQQIVDAHNVPTQLGMPL